MSLNIIFLTFASLVNEVCFVYLDNISGLQLMLLSQILLFIWQLSLQIVAPCQMEMLSVSTQMIPYEIVLWNKDKPWNLVVVNIETQ